MTAIKIFYSQFIIFCFHGGNSKHFHERRPAYLTVWIFNLGMTTFLFEMKTNADLKKRKGEKNPHNLCFSVEDAENCHITLHSQVCRPVPHAQCTQSSI